jgi:heme iron utilization protein
MSEQIPDLRVVRNELEDLQRDFATLLMATVSADGVPDASYAAYVERDGDYYVYISELSTHTRNLVANGLASVLFIENEAQAGHPFARRRLSYQCEAIEVARDSAEFESTLEVFAGRFGNLIATLRELQDFHLFRLRPLHGLYVAGFARAYVVDAVDRQRLRHVRDKGHRGSARADGTSGDERE